MDTAKSPHIISAADASADPVVTGAIFVKRVRWISKDAESGDKAIIKDTKGRVLWEGVATGANYAEADLLETTWPNGYAVTTLGTGTLYVYFE